MIQTGTLMRILASSINLTRDSLVLQATVFSLCVFTDDNDIHIFVASLYSWNALTVNHIGKQIQFNSEMRHMKIIAHAHKVMYKSNLKKTLRES